MKRRWVDSTMGMRNPREENSWIPLEFGKFKAHKPTIICLPGGGCDTPKKANGFCKFVAHLTGFKESEKDIVDMYEHVDIVGFSYGWESRTIGASFIDEEIEDIVDGMLLSLCEDEKGDRLEVDLAKQNLANITFFSYCHGAKELSKIMANLEQKLQQKGYSVGDIEKLFGSLMHITYAPESAIEYLKTISFCSLQDKMLFKFKKNYEEKFGKDLNGIDIVYQPKDTTLNFEAKSDCVNVYSSKLNNFMFFDYDEHTFRFLNRDDKNWKHFGTCGVSSPNADCMSQMMAYAIASSVAASANGNRKPTIKQMIASLESVKNSFNCEELEMGSREI